MAMRRHINFAAALHQLRGERRTGVLTEPQNQLYTRLRRAYLVADRPLAVEVVAGSDMRVLSALMARGLVRKTDRGFTVQTSI